MLHVMLTAASRGPNHKANFATGCSKRGTFARCQNDSIAMLSLNQKLDLLQVIGDQFPFGSFHPEFEDSTHNACHYAFTFWVDRWDP